MSWFSKDKKEGDFNRLPEIPNTGSLMVKRSQNFGANQDNSFPDFPPIPKRENRPLPPVNNNFDQFKEESFSNKEEESFNFAKEFNARNNPDNNSSMYNSIGDEDKPMQRKSPPLRNVNHSMQNIEPEENFKRPIRRVPMEMPPKKSMVPAYNSEMNNERENIQKSNMYYDAEEEKRKVFTKDTEPIFIRLDKFQTTIQSINEIKSKINEIESLLNKTKEIRSREDKELEEWENEIGIIKSKLDLIDKNIFERVG